MTRKHMPPWIEDELYDLQVAKDIDKKSWDEVMVAVNEAHGNHRSAEACRDQYRRLLKRGEV